MKPTVLAAITIPLLVTNAYSFEVGYKPERQLPKGGYYCTMVRMDAYKKGITYLTKCSRQQDDIITTNKQFETIFIDNSLSYVQPVLPGFDGKTIECNDSQKQYCSSLYIEKSGSFFGSGYSFNLKKFQAYMEKNKGLFVGMVDKYTKISNDLKSNSPDKIISSLSGSLKEGGVKVSKPAACKITLDIGEFSSYEVDLSKVIADKIQLKAQDTETADKYLALPGELILPSKSEQAVQVIEKKKEGNLAAYSKCIMQGATKAEMDLLEIGGFDADNMKIGKFCKQYYPVIVESARHSADSVTFRYMKNYEQYILEAFKHLARTCN